MGFNLNNAVTGGGLFGGMGTFGGFDDISGGGDLFGVSGQDLWGGGSGQTQSTSSSGPWKPQQPFLQDLYSQAQNQFQNQSPFTQQAQQMQAQRGMAGSPLNRAAGEGLQETMQGAYMPGGEKYQDISGALLNQIRPAIDTQFAGGRYGSGLHKQGLASNLSDKLIMNMNQERQNMMGAMGMAPGQAAQDYMDIGQVAQAGQVPWQQLQNYQGLLGAPVSTSQRQSTGMDSSTGGIIPGISGLLQGLT